MLNISIVIGFTDIKLLYFTEFTDQFTGSYFKGYWIIFFFIASTVYFRATFICSRKWFGYGRIFFLITVIVNFWTSSIGFRSL